MKKISCGGFYIDENNFNIDEEGKLSLKSTGALVLTLTPKMVGNPRFGTFSGATDEEIVNALRSGRGVVALLEQMVYYITVLNGGRAESYSIQISNGTPIVVYYYLLLDGSGRYNSSVYTGLVESN